MYKYKPTFKTCAVCGKRFVVYSFDYVYKKYKGHGNDQKRLYFCGWNHMRQWEKETESERKHKRGKSRQADYG